MFSANHLRSLAWAGVISLALGFGVLIAILGSRQGFSDSVDRVMTSAGADRFIITREQGAKTGEYFDQSTLGAVAECPSVAGVAGQKPVRGTPGTVAFRPDGKRTIVNYPIRVRNVTENYFGVNGLKLSAGRLFTPQEASSGAHVAVVGAGLAQDLKLAPGSVIKQDPWLGDPLTVIGVLSQAGEDISSGVFTFGEGDPHGVGYSYSAKGGPDYTAFIPMNCAARVYGLKPFAVGSYTLIVPEKGVVQSETPKESLAETPIPAGIELVVVPKPGLSSRLTTEVLAALRARGYHDAVVRPSSSLYMVFTRVRGNLSRLFLYVSLLALILGAINVSNLVLLRQLREAHATGVRRAVGAGRRHVIRRVLADSARVSTLGGLLGLGVGFALQFPLSNLIGQELRIGVVAVIAGLGALAAAAFFAALYPALLVLRMTPSDAIRGGLTGVGRPRGAETARQVLSGLGLAVGVAAVSLIMALGHGEQAEIERYLRAAGRDLLVVKEADVFAAGGRERAALDPGTVAEIKARMGDELVTAGWRESAQVSLGDEAKSATAWVVASDAGGLGFGGLKWAWGRTLTSDDVEQRRAVAVVGAKLAEELGVGRPRGADQTVEILGRRLVVVGVLAPRPAGVKDYGPDRDRAVYLPYTAARDLGLLSALMTTREVWLDARPGHVEPVKQALEAFFSERYAGQAPPAVVTPAAALSELAGVQRDLSRVLMVLALLALAVGAFGVTTHMFARVEEATPFIGVRRAVGASRGDVARQYLVAALKLALVSTGAGLTTALMAWIVIARVRDLPWSVPPLAIVLPAATGVVAGLAFGSAPALRAAHLSPAEAIRRE